MIGLIVVTDGRADYLAETLEAAWTHLPPFDRRWIIDDSGDIDYPKWLRSNYSATNGLGFEVVHHETRRGMAGAVKSAWATATNAGCDYILHLEDDMVFTRSPPVVEACAYLDKHVDLSQVCFKREPWWGREVDLGDQLAAICEAASESFPLGDLTFHNHIFSLNPCVVPRRVFEQGWPDGNEAEQTERLRNAGWWFSTWGVAGDAPYVRHIGHVRGAGWQL